jgi:hypothetical protein
MLKKSKVDVLLLDLNMKGNTGYDLSDGARIYVTRTKFADRNKNIYGVPIKPDIEVSYGHTKEAAINWINKK